LEKERIRGIERETENFIFILFKKNWKGGGTIRKKERRSERENLNQENGRGRKRVRDSEILNKII
jgi:hypothetical protein